MKNPITALFLVSSFTLFCNTLYSQSTPITCDCQLDTLGLAAYIATLNLSENNPLSIEVQNTNSKFAVLHGTIGNTTPARAQTFINNYPNVTTLVFMSMPGSENDNANLEASRALRNRGYTTYLPAVQAYDTDAFIASGAVDMFLLGNKRVIDQNGEVGVHAWADESGNSATDYPVGHAVHQFYINYYVEMGFSQADAEAFYYFTINAATADNIHLMSEAEIEQYKLRTCVLANNCENNCMNDIVLTSENLPNGETETIHRMAVNTIETSVAIQENVNITYTAGQGILLKSGFQTGNNSLFHAYLESCTLPNLRPEPESITSKTGGSETLNQVEISPQLKIQPNPFIYSTEFHFLLTETSDIQLVVHDFQGRLINTIKQINLSKGWHSSPFDAQNLRLGMYNVTLISQSDIITKKMIIINQ